MHFFFLLVASMAFGQQSRDLSKIDFGDKNPKFPNPGYVDVYNNQNNFVIHPDYHLTQQWVKAGAYFRYNGKNVRAENVSISVYLPKHGNVWGYREHNESNVNAPDWSGWWDEPWKNGFFCYTVKAKYQGVWYETAFEVRPNSYFGLLGTALEGLKLRFNYQNGK